MKGARIGVDLRRAVLCFVSYRHSMPIIFEGSVDFETQQHEATSPLHYIQTLWGIRGISGLQSLITYVCQATDGKITRQPSGKPAAGLLAASCPNSNVCAHADRQNLADRCA